MANEINIPSLDVAQRGIIDMSSPQVDVGKVQQDPALVGLSALSKTAMQGGAIAASLVPLENEQRKTKEKYEKALNEYIKGLKGHGAINDEEAYAIIRAEEGRIQREGLIKAYDSFVFTDEIDRNRNKVRMQAVQTYVNNNKAGLTNPTKPLSVDQVIDDALATLGAAGALPVRDAAGNLIDMDFNNMSAGESMLFLSGLQEMKFGLDQAVAEVREARTLEASANMFQGNLYDALSSGESSKENQEIFRNVLQTGYDLGVTDINSRVLTTADTIANDTLENTAQWTASEYTSVMNMYDFLMDGAISREDNGVNILFATRGTQNYQKLQEQRDAFQRAWSSGSSAYAKALAGEVEQVQLDITNRAAEAWLLFSQEKMEKGEPVSERDKDKFRMEFQKLALKAGVTDMTGFNTDMNNILDSYSGNVRDERVAAELMFSLEFAVNTVEGTEKVSKMAFDWLNEGKISWEDYNKVLTKASSARTRLLEGKESVHDKALKQLGLSWNHIRTDSSEWLRNALKQNNMQMLIPTGAGVSMALTSLYSYDDEPLAATVNKAREEHTRLAQAALSGEDYTPEDWQVLYGSLDIDKLKEMGVKEGYIIGVTNTLGKPPSWVGKGIVTTVEDDVARYTEAQKRAEAYARLLALVDMQSQYKTRDEIENELNRTTQWLERVSRSRQTREVQ